MNLYLFIWAAEVTDGLASAHLYHLWRILYRWLFLHFGLLDIPAQNLALCLLCALAWEQRFGSDAWVVVTWVWVIVAWILALWGELFSKVGIGYCCSCYSWCLVNFYLETRFSLFWMILWLDKLIVFGTTFDEHGAPIPYFLISFLNDLDITIYIPNFLILYCQNRFEFGFQIFKIIFEILSDFRARVRYLLRTIAVHEASSALNFISTIFTSLFFRFLRHCFFVIFISTLSYRHQFLLLLRALSRVLIVTSAVCVVFEFVVSKVTDLHLSLLSFFFFLLSLNQFFNLLILLLILVRLHLPWQISIQNIWSLFLIFSLLSKFIFFGKELLYQFVS